MSLETAIEKLTEAVLAQTELIKNGSVPSGTEKKKTTKKATKKSTKEIPESVNKSTLTAAAALPPLQGGHTEPVGIDKTTVTNTLENANPEAVEAPMGSAPMTKGSEYYQYCMNLCNQLSSFTGDPTLAAEIMRKHNVIDIGAAEDLALQPIVEEVIASITALDETPVEA